MVRYKMVEPITPFVPSTFSRVSTILGRDVILANLRRISEDILLSQQQLSTGIRVLFPSLDPVASVKIINFQNALGRIKQFSKNLEVANSQLSFTDSLLQNLTDIGNKAREISLQQIGSNATAQTRLLAATEVEQLIDRVQDVLNTKYEGKFIFGGSKTTTPPAGGIGNLVFFAGDLEQFSIRISDILSVQSNVTVDELGLVAEYKGLTDTLTAIDLDPRITPETKLSALRAGKGIPPGSIVVSGTNTAVIDLSQAQTVNDVINLINAQSATTGVTISINPAQNGFQLDSTTGFVSVSEVAGGKTAEALGILTTSSPTPFFGADLDPALTEETRLGDLYGGAGVDPLGIVLTNSGSGLVFTATLGPAVFASSTTIGELIQAINNSGVYVSAKINEQRTGIDLISRLSGGRFRVDENGGSTALQFGWRYSLPRVDVDDVFQGYGLGTVEGADIKITLKNGDVVTLDLDRARVVRDIVEMIDQQPNLDAVIVGNQIQITDNSAGVGVLKIEDMSGSVAAFRLGILGEVSGGPGPVTLTGTAVNFVGVQPPGILSALITLREGLVANNPDKIGVALREIENAGEKILATRGTVGARINSIELAQNRYQIEEVEVQKFLSQERDLDYAEAITKFQIQQFILQAALATASRILQTSILNYL